MELQLLYYCSVRSHQCYNLVYSSTVAKVEIKSLDFKIIIFCIYIKHFLMVLSNEVYKPIKKNSRGQGTNKIK